MSEWENNNKDYSIRETFGEIPAAAVVSATQVILNSSSADWEAQHNDVMFVEMTKSY